MPQFSAGIRFVETSSWRMAHFVLWVCYPHPGEIPYEYQAHLAQGPNPAIRYCLQYEQPPVNHYPHESGTGDWHPLHADPQKLDTDQLIP
jgi:hypothetical protein